NSLACCSGVMPMPVSATASSIQSRPLATLRARSLTSPSLVNLQALLRRLPHGVHRQCAEVVLGVNDEAVFFLLGNVVGGGADLVDQRRWLHGLWVELELSGLDLRQVEHLVDEAKEVCPSAVHALERLLRLFCSKARGVGDQHVGEPDDGVEWRAQLMAHARYELRLVLARQLELAALVPDFVE